MFCCFDPVSSLAAAFCTRCSFSISATGNPQNRLLQLSIREDMKAWINPIFRSASSLFTRETIASCSGYQTGVSSFGSNSEQRLQRGFWHNRHKYFVVSKHEKHISISRTYNSKTFRPCRHFGFVMQAHDHLWKERKKQIILIYAFYSAHENRTRPTVDFPK